MVLVRDRSFILTTGNGPRIRLGRLRNGVPQKSALVHFFNHFISGILPYIENFLSKFRAYYSNLKPEVGSGT